MIMTMIMCFCHINVMYPSIIKLARAISIPISATSVPENKISLHHDKIANVVFSFRLLFSFRFRPCSTCAVARLMLTTKRRKESKKERKIGKKERQISHLLIVLKYNAAPGGGVTPICR